MSWREVKVEEMGRPKILVWPSRSVPCTRDKRELAASMHFGELISTTGICPFCLLEFGETEFPLVRRPRNPPVSTPLSMGLHHVPLPLAFTWVLITELRS